RVRLALMAKAFVTEGLVSAENKENVLIDLKVAGKFVRSQIHWQLELSNDDQFSWSKLSDETVMNAADILEEMAADGHIPLNLCIGR
ncbi:hypothetical protein DFQ30_004789, partial [Apophysomyces sp. BC1015]